MNEGYARYDLQKGHFDINEFRGFNATSSRAASEMQDMMNLSSENYPYLSPRKGRAFVELPENIGKIEKVFRTNGKLCFIAGGKLWYDGKPVVEGITSEGEKSVAVCNGVICVMPDKVYYDYLNDKGGYLDEKITFVIGSSDADYIKYDKYYGLCFHRSDFELVDYYPRAVVALRNLLKIGDRISIYSCDGEGIVEGQVLSFRMREEEPIGVMLKLDEKYETDMPIYLGIAGVMYINGNLRSPVIISSRLIVEYLYSDMAINVRFDEDTSSEYSDSIISKLKEFFPVFSKGETIVCSETSVDIDGNITNQIAKTSTVVSTYSIKSEWGVFSCKVSSDLDFKNNYYGFVTLQSKIPDMDFICEKDNRIFGVCNSDNTVVASKLGDPFEFYSFSGTSLDSYSVNVGSDGDFTGIVNYNGGIVLFKERYIHLLSGAKPSLFRLEGIETYGVEKGCCDSICCINGRLFYKSLRGIYVFDGSYPVCVSRCFGDVKYSDAFAADDDRRYYVSMMNPEGKRLLFVYDSEGGLWHIEDSHNAVSMCELDGDIYIAEAENVMKLGDNSSEAVSWYATFGPFDMYTVNKKVISSVSIRYKLPSGSLFRVEVSYDGGDFCLMNEIFDSNNTVLFCEIPIKRCNEFSLRLSGVGDIRIQGISLTLREGTGK